MESMEEEIKVSWKDVARNLVFLLVIIGIAYIVTVKIGLDNLEEKVRLAGWFAPFILIILKATTIVVAPLGGTIIYPVAGAIFGFSKGLFLCLLGDTLGSTIAFFLSRRFGRSILHFFIGKSQYPMLEKILLRLGEKRSFVKARIFFTGFMDLFAYASGLSKINYLFFITVHIAVHSVLAIMYVGFGNLLVSGRYSFFTISLVATTLLAGAGIWLFQLDVEKGN